MVRGKRIYTPKVRGCYECSQRRIHCDRAQPSCAKCVAKGIHCSGLGVRYRFRNDVLNIGKPSEREAPRYQLAPDDCDAENPEEEAVKKPQSDAIVNTDTSEVIFEPRDGQGSDLPSDSIGDSSDDNAVLQLARSTRTIGTQTSLSAFHWSPADAYEDLTLFSVAPADTFESWKRYFLGYFSNYIASEMVVIDDNSNGWRHLILPVAHSDDLVREAVVAASVFHFSANNQSQLFDPTSIYAVAVRKLHQRQNLDSYDMTGKQTVLLALLVLLTAAIVQGSSEFLTIFNLVESALSAIGGEEIVMEGELGVFLVRQIRKYRGYVAPYVSQNEGIARLSLTTLFGLEVSNGWECFKSYYQKHPELAEHLLRIYSLQQQGCNIYVARATAGSDASDHSESIAKYIEDLELIPAGSTGEHTLVFPTFIAALESTLPEHQEYLANALEKHHQRNGFANIPLGLEYLKSVWADRTGTNWTETLPTMKGFIV